jgi:hypothetical protein
MDFLATPIKTESDAEGFFFQLEQNGLLFHPEDDPADIFATDSEHPLFTVEQCDLLRKRIDEAYAVMADPCEYILTLDTYRVVDDEERSRGL